MQVRIDRLSPRWEHTKTPYQTGLQQSSTSRHRHRESLGLTEVHALSTAKHMMWCFCLLQKEGCVTPPSPFALLYRRKKSPNKRISQMKAWWKRKTWHLPTHWIRRIHAIFQRCHLHRPHSWKAGILPEQYLLTKSRTINITANRERWHSLCCHTQKEQNFLIHCREEQGFCKMKVEMLENPQQPIHSLSNWLLQIQSFPKNNAKGREKHPNTGKHTDSGKKGLWSFLADAQNQTRNWYSKNNLLCML